MFVASHEEAREGATWRSGRNAKTWKCRLLSKPAPDRWNGCVKKTRDLGPIGKSNSAHERGLIMHNALAFSASGVALGLLSQTLWARQAVPEEGYQEKIERLQCAPIEEKESAKWWLSLRETVGRAPPGVKLITVADRESDCFEFITEAHALGALFLIRARTDRKLVPEDSAGHESILEALTSAAVLGTLTVRIPGNARPARQRLRCAWHRSRSKRRHDAVKPRRRPRWSRARST
jgi:hypothetical protein